MFSGILDTTMTRFLKVLALLSVSSVAGFALISPAPAVNSTDTVTTDYATAYGTHCSRCHGADGKANTAKGRELDADDLTTSKVQGMSTAKLTRIIKKGKGDMPGFPNLTPAQITSIIRTVKSF